MHINWHGNVLDHSGYANVSRGFLYELNRRGYNISLLTNTTFMPMDQSLRRFYEVKKVVGSYAKETGAVKDIGAISSMIKRFEPGITITKRTPGQVLSGLISKPHIAFPVFEAEPVPFHWINHLNNPLTVDEVWTSSQYCVDIFKRSGLEKPIFLIHEGVDTELFKPVSGFDVFHTGDDFVFFSNFQWSERKAPDLLLKAFFTAFGPEEPVKLVIKTFLGFVRLPPEKEIELINRKIEMITSQLGIADTRNVVLIVQTISDEVMPNLYNSADCYVSTSRSEGVGRTNLEAMACGLPLITPDCSGMSDYAKSEYAYMVSAESGKRVQMMDNISENYRNTFWFEPSWKEIAEKMRFVYEHREEAKEIGNRARQAMVNNFGWEVVSEKMIERIKYWEENI